MAALNHTEYFIVPISIAIYDGFKSQNYNRVAENDDCGKTAQFVSLWNVNKLRESPNERSPIRNKC